MDGAEHILRVHVVHDPSDGSWDEPVLTLVALSNLSVQPLVETIRLMQRLNLVTERREAMKHCALKLIDSGEPRRPAGAIGQHERDHPASIRKAQSRPRRLPRRLAGMEPLVSSRCPITSRTLRIRKVPRSISRFTQGSSGSDNYPKSPGAMSVKREKWPWKATVTVSVGPLRCLATMRSASPARGESFS